MRDHFDLPLLRNFSESKGDTLRYFGLPGAECRDLHAWKEYISEVAAVERVYSNLTEMEKFLSRYLSEISFQTHFGDVDDVILKGRGNLRKVGGKETRPEVANRYEDGLDCHVWAFDLIYLDYFGPFLPSPDYPLTRSKRPRALRRLFEEERLDGREPWLLLLTVDCTNYSQDDLAILATYLLSAKDGKSERAQAALDYLLSEEDLHSDYVVKLVHGTLGVLVSGEAGHANLRVQSRGAVSYSGFRGQRMLHMAFQFTPSKILLDSSFDPAGLLQAPIITPLLPGDSVTFGWAFPTCPGATEDSVRQCLDFMDEYHVSQVLDGGLF